MVEIPTPAGGDSIAHDISSDGAVVVGSFEPALISEDHAFRWTAATGTEDLGFLPGGTLSRAVGACGTGAAAVGQASASNGVMSAVRWKAGTLLNLGAGYAEDCSTDGNTVVGTEGNRQVAFRWTAKDGMRLLGALGGSTSESHATSANGLVVVGGAGLPFVNGVSDYAAFRWENGKMQNLKTVLQTSGVTSVSGWTLTLALGISPDGAVIVGVGDDPSGVTQAYRAVAPVAPK
jgi:probable HAF family extracellular repeat protein